MDAEDLLLREFLGIRDARRRPSEAARWIRSAAARRRHLGQLLRRPGRPVDHGRGLGRAAAGRRRAGRRRTWRAAAGVRPRIGRRRARPGSSPGSGWRCSACGRGTTCPTLPPELILLPRWFPLNVYDFACWARQTDRPADRSSARCGRCARCRSASTSCAPGCAPPAPAAGCGPGRRRLPACSTGSCTRYARRPIAPLRRAAHARAPPSGSSRGRRPTAAGAASSRRGSTRCSPCTCSATRSTTR